MDKESAYIKSIISSIQPLPPRKQVIGKTTVSWWEGKPGDAVIMSEGGTAKDEIISQSIVAAELAKFGYKRAKFHFAEESDPMDVLDREREGTDEPADAKAREKIDRRQHNWNNLVEKAKRLVNSGNVTIVKNDPDYVYGRVIGDHGSYECRILRSEPDSSLINSWKCTCPWDQYARQRTRQWKIYEGRPCSHILALYYVAKMVPTSEAEDEFVSVPPGATEPPAIAGEPSPFGTPPGVTGPEGMPGGVVPSVPEGPEGIRQLTPFKPEDVGAMDPDELLEQRLGPLAPPRMKRREEEERSEMPDLPEGLKPPEPRRNIQKPPLERLREMEREKEEAMDAGMSPYGRPAPPGTVSVPGARQPTPRHPFVVPGTYSKIKNPVFAMTSINSSNKIAKGTECEILGSDPHTGFVEVLFKSANVRCYVNSDDLEIN